MVQPDSTIDPHAPPELDGLGVGCCCGCPWLLQLWPFGEAHRPLLKLKHGGSSPGGGPIVALLSLLFGGRRKKSNGDGLHGAHEMSPV